MRLLVTGGRDFEAEHAIWSVLDNIHQSRPITVLIHGGATGADALAAAWAKSRHIEILAFLANWSEFGREAGTIRNREMIYEGQPDFIFAFPGGRGAAEMLKLAAVAGIEQLGVWVDDDALVLRSAFPGARLTEFLANFRKG